MITLRSRIGSTYRVLVIAAAVFLLFISLSFWMSYNPPRIPKHTGFRSTSRRVERSNELYSDMLKKRYEFIARIGNNTNPFTGEHEMILWDYFPPSWTCPHELTRVGVIGDGGKWVCGADRLLSLKNCTIYSFGVERKSSFEAELLNRSGACNVWAYDFSVNTIGPEILANQDYNRRTTFRPYRLDTIDAAANNTEPEKHTLHGIMEENGHTWIDILKIDVEGSEYEVLKEIVSRFSGQPLPFGQLQMEIHAWEGNFTYWLEWWEILESAGLRPFSRELNYPAAAYRHAPTVVEYGFINIGLQHALIDDSLE